MGISVKTLGRFGMVCLVAFGCGEDEEKKGSGGNGNATVQVPGGESLALTNNSGSYLRRVAPGFQSTAKSPTEVVEKVKGFEITAPGLGVDRPQLRLGDGSVRGFLRASALIPPQSAASAPQGMDCTSILNSMNETITGQQGQIKQVVEELGSALASLEDGQAPDGMSLVDPQEGETFRAQFVDENSATRGYIGGGANGTQALLTLEGIANTSKAQSLLDDESLGSGFEENDSEGKMPQRVFGKMRFFIDGNDTMPIMALGGGFSSVQDTDHQGSALSAGVFLQLTGGSTPSFELVLEGAADGLDAFSPGVGLQAPEQMAGQFSFNLTQVSTEQVNVSVNFTNVDTGRLDISAQLVERSGQCVMQNVQCQGNGEVCDGIKRSLQGGMSPVDMGQ